MTPLTSPEGLTGLVFIGAAAATICGAVIAATVTTLMRAVTGLALACLGLAGLFYFLNSPFVALMEILIYVGAVCVMLVFGIMLAPARPGDGRANRNLGAAAAVIGGGILVAFLIRIGFTTEWPTVVAAANDGSVAAIGRALLTTYSMVFELISLVLLVAILGALVVARSGRGTVRLGGGK